MMMIARQEEADVEEAEQQPQQGPPPPSSPSSVIRHHHTLFVLAGVAIGLALAMIGAVLTAPPRSPLGRRDHQVYTYIRQSPSATYLPTYIFTYFLTYLPTYLPTNHRPMAFSMSLFSMSKKMTMAVLD